MDLTNVERLLLSGHMAKEREIHAKFLVPLQKDIADITKLIEERLGLVEGSLGKTHRIDFDKNCIVEIEPKPETKE